MSASVVVVVFPAVGFVVVVAVVVAVVGFVVMLYAAVSFVVDLFSLVGEATAADYVVVVVVDKVVVVDEVVVVGGLVGVLDAALVVLLVEAAITVSVVVAEFSPSAVVVLFSVSLFQFFSSVYLFVDRFAVSGEQFVDYQSTAPPMLANDREYSIVGNFSAVFLQWLCTHVFFVLVLLSTQQCL